MEEDIKNSKKTFLKIIIIFSIIIFCVCFFFLIYSAVFAQKVYLGVYVGGKHVGGMTYSDLYNFLENKTKQFDSSGINYKFNNFTYNIKPSIEETGSDGYRLIYFETDKTAKIAYSFGRDSNFFKNSLNKILILVYPKKVRLKYDFNNEKWKEILQNEFKQFETEFIFPKVIFDIEDITISNPQDGKLFDYDKLILSTEKQINNLDTSDIKMELQTIKCPVSIKEAESQRDLIKNIINLGEISLKFEDKSWNIKSDIYKNWFVIKEKDKKILIGFDFENYKKYMEEKVIGDINIEVQDAKFSMNSGKVSEFIGSQDGREVDLEKTLNDLEYNLNSLIKETQIVVNITKSDVSTNDINDLGIKEIIGTGESDFKGSPKNRIHNIKTGANKLNGLLIKPGEEFYTIKNLLPIDADGGYLTELVIKGNRTVPEYGGGLCQIGTTMFRAAIQSGLKITQRRPHSYRVVYYEPAGMDATIYDPMPDLRFINDTGNYILIQSRIVGTKLYFDFWGTKDGRIIDVSKPVIYNIVRPGPTKMIETTELEPGKKNCIESAHNGADAYFDYKVEYIDGTKNEERFSSHYVPWQAVCLVGATASSTTGGSIGGSTGSSTTSTSQ